MLKSLLIPALVFSPIAAGHVSGEPLEVTLRVEDRSGRTSSEPLVMASSLNAWNPADPRWTLELEPEADRDEPRPGATRWWTITFAAPTPPGMPDDGVVEFKFTRGGWNLVEVDAAGGDVGNRRLEAAQIKSAAGKPITLPAVEGFIDQRGTRWPNLTPPPPPGAPVKSTVTGTLDVLDFESTTLKNTRKVRVWTPPGYAAGGAGGQGKAVRYPVLYMHDGQNCFDAATSFAGVEWSCDEAATALIKEGKIRPLIIVGMDNTGGTRAEEYNPPYTRYLDKQNRGDAYLKFVVDEVMPYINKNYRTLTGPEHTGIGGSSFGGNASLYAIMERPDVFGRAIVESAAVFLDNAAIVKKLRENEKWPLKMFVAVGTAETARSGDAKAFADLNREMMDVMRSKGLGDDRLVTIVEEGARHFEEAWAKRFPAALGFIFSVEPTGR
ncbi:MAG: alpha/beta hydrolase [Phycisphaerales bacterium]